MHSKENPIVDTIEPIARSMGFDVVEASLNRSHKLSHIRVILYRPEGVNLEDCTRVSRLIRPRLELEYPELFLEVSSPGIERTIKSPAEYTIFRGKGVKLLRESESEWTSGRIEAVEGETLVLNKQDSIERVPLSEIRKARLDPAQEGEE